MAVLVTQPMPADPWKDLWQCCTPTKGLDLSPSMNTLVQPPKIASSVSHLYNALVLSDGRDSSIIEHIISAHVSASCEAQQRAAAIFAGRQSDEDKDNRFPDFPEIPINGAWDATIEGLKQKLKSCGVVVRGKASKERHSMGATPGGIGNLQPAKGSHAELGRTVSARRRTSSASPVGMLGT